MAPAQRWTMALLALRLLALDPLLGGISVKARAGPVRDRWLDALARLNLPLRKVPLSVSDEQLFGGIDLTATLAAGREIRSNGLLAEPCALLVPMVERAEPGLAARLGQALDGEEHILIALDESADEGADEGGGLPASLRDRLAFHIDLDGIACGDALTGFGTLPDATDTSTTAKDIAAIAELCERFGVASPRAALHCLRAAGAHAMLHRRRAVAPEDIEAAAILTLAPHATRLPETRDETPPPPPGDTSDAPGDGDGLDIPQEMLLEAVRAMLPADILAQVAAKRRRGAKGSGAGAKRTGNRRGRPLTPRAGRPDGRARIDIVATLRAAAPWQTFRKATSAHDRPVEIRAPDIRLKRFEEKSDRLLVFAVDASGSAAFARLGEAKGAVELLLAEAYARRDYVALVGFRGARADILLPPTRSLVQTKRRLAELPGGGGTPLAAGLRAATELAAQAKSRGMTPTLILLTDGRANVALDGEADRKRAAADAARMAQVALIQGVEALVIDMGKRPERALRTLAETLDATYVPLPRANARSLSDAVTGALT